MYGDKPWHAVTNSNLYNKSEEERKQMCRRYRKAYDILEKLEGKGTWLDAMKTLKAVSQGHPIDGNTTGTLWSFSADIADRTLYLCIHSEYDKVYKFDFE